MAPGLVPCARGTYSVRCLFPGGGRGWPSGTRPGPVLQGRRAEQEGGRWPGNPLAGLAAQARRKTTSGSLFRRSVRPWLPTWSATPRFGKANGCWTLPAAPAWSRGSHRSRSAPPEPSPDWTRSEEHTSELQSLMRISYAVFCLKKKKNIKQKHRRENIKQKQNNKNQRRLAKINTYTRQNEVRTE